MWVQKFTSKFENEMCRKYRNIISLNGLLIADFGSTRKKKKKTLN